MNKSQIMSWRMKWRVLRDNLNYIHIWFWDFIIIIKSVASSVLSSIIGTVMFFILINNVNCHLEVGKSVKIIMFWLMFWLLQ